jgi:hypothetical protein
MFFHKHTYDSDKSIAALIHVVNNLEAAVLELQEDVAYLIEVLGEDA